MRIISFVFFSLLTSTLWAQSNAFRNNVDFGNVGFQTIDIQGYSFKNNGLTLFSNNASQYFDRFKSRAPVKILDSNSLSEVDFNLGNKATQQIGFNLDRPVSKKSKVVLGVYRASNPGWLSRNFVRKTDLNGEFYSQLTQRISMRVLLRAGLIDLEQNGGYVDSTSYSLISSGAGDLELLSNIFLDQAYSRQAFQEATTGYTYNFINRKLLKVYGDLEIGYQNQSFRYIDDNPNGVFYAGYNVTSSSGYRDSILVRTLKVMPAVTLERIDTSKNSTLQLTGGFNQNFNWLTTNSNTGQPPNQSVFASGVYSRNRITLSGLGENYVVGYNRGDIILKTDLRIVLVDRDSNRTMLELTTGIRQDATSPYLVERDFPSTVRSNWSALKKENHTRTYIGLGVKKSNWYVSPIVSYDLIQNLIYFDRSAKIQQNTDVITLFSGALAASYNGEHLRFGSKGTYQWNNRERTYSLPEWINASFLQTRWPIFKKRVVLVGSLESIYYSGFFVRGYNPFYQSRYVQTSHRFDDYFQLDGSLELEIKTAVVGIRASNLLYGVVNDNPIIAPFYPSVPRYFSLHINWRFRN